MYADVRYVIKLVGIGHRDGAVRDPFAGLPLDRSSPVVDTSMYIAMAS